MQESSTTATAVVVGFVWCHIDEVLRTYNLFYHVAKVISHGVAKGLSHQLARILDGELNLQVFVPVGIDRKFSFPDPLSVVLDDAGNFKVVFNVEFFQSGPDCK